MTYHTDPSRWTDSLAEAPEALRAPFAAARNEGPSDLQMKALALKLAALSAGTAAAASAATAKAAASTTAGGAAAASTGAISMAKVAVSVALFGATITGAVVWQGKVSVRQSAQQTPVVQVAPATLDTEGQAAERQLESARSGKGAFAAPSTGEAAPVSPGAAPVEFEASEAAGNGVAADKSRVTSPSDENARSVRASSVRATSTSSRARSNAVEAPAAKSSAAVSATSAKSTEVDLLRRARAALASRPREAFAITQEHRDQYPSGMFAQERDALAIEALMRAGEMSTARTLAERFVREHPSSPHAHRFRETMDLR